MLQLSIALAAAIVGPLVLTWLIGRQRHRDKLDEWAREDRRERIARGRDRRANRKLNTIHTLVNSNMTAQIQDSLDATRRELASLLENIDLKKALGHQPTPEVEAAVELAKRKIAELETTLDHRLKQTDKADRADRQAADDEANVREDERAADDRRLEDFDIQDGAEDLFGGSE